MSSSADIGRRGTAATFRVWNRRVHYYLGLYFLFFIWLFALTGWLLNHPRWIQSVGANAREETRYERMLPPLVATDELGRAREIMRHLNLAGEIGWPVAQPNGAFTFNVSRPTESAQVRVDLKDGHAAVRHFDNSAMAAFRIFHTTSGTRYTDAATRDWVLTTVWVVAMDALAIGLLVMVLGGYYLWWRLEKKRVPGVVALVAGVAACAAFVAGLF